MEGLHLAGKARLWGGVTWEILSIKDLCLEVLPGLSVGHLCSLPELFLQNRVLKVPSQDHQLQLRWNLISNADFQACPRPVEPETEVCVEG